MARPREFDRDQALLLARDAFWERGYAGTSMADLVAALGLAPPRLYAAFGSKEELFRKAVEHYEAHEGGFVARALQEEPTARQAMERMFRDAIDIYTRPDRPKGCMVVTAAVNCAEENDDVRDWLAERRRKQTASIVERLKRAQRDGEIRPESDAQALGDYLATLMHGLSVQARDGVPKKKLQAACRLALMVLAQAALS